MGIPFINGLRRFLHYFLVRVERISVTCDTSGGADAQFYFLLPFRHAERQGHGGISKMSRTRQILIGDIQHVVVAQMAVTHLLSLAKQYQQIAVPTVGTPKTGGEVILPLRIHFHREGHITTLHSFAGHRQQHTGRFFHPSSDNLGCLVGKTMSTLGRRLSEDNLVPNSGHTCSPYIHCSYHPHGTPTKSQYIHGSFLF